MPNRGETKRGDIQNRIAEHEKTNKERLEEEQRQHMVAEVKNIVDNPEDPHHFIARMNVDVSNPEVLKRALTDLLWSDLGAQIELQDGRVVIDNSTVTGRTYGFDAQAAEEDAQYREVWKNSESLQEFRRARSEMFEAAATVGSENRELEENIKIYINTLLKDNVDPDHDAWKAVRKPENIAAVKFLHSNSYVSIKNSILHFEFDGPEGKYWVHKLTHESQPNSDRVMEWKEVGKIEDILIDAEIYSDNLRRDS